MICEAICEGVANRKKHDQSNTVSTSKMTYMGLKRFVRHVCDLQGSNHDAVEGIPLTTMRDGAHRHTAEYPGHWLDDWHEEDGGDDRRGVRPQIGVTLLKKETEGLSFKSGYALDHVTNAELIPDLVKQARQVEMCYFQKLGV